MVVYYYKQNKIQKKIIIITIIIIIITGQQTSVCRKAKTQREHCKRKKKCHIIGVHMWRKKISTEIQTDKGHSQKKKYE